MGKGVHLDLAPLTLEDIPEPSTPAFELFLNDYFAAAETLAASMGDWPKHSTRVDGTVHVVQLTSGSIRKQLDIKDYWCGRISHHTPESVAALAKGGAAAPGLVRRLSHRLSSHHAPTVDPHASHADKQAAVMQTRPRGLYERFRRGLLEYHSENEREYIEACRETECLEVLQPHVAEVWRLTYVTPPPTSPRTFVVLLLSRELASEPDGERCFMNVSLPFHHPNCVEKSGEERSRVRGRYVSVERVRELDAGSRVEWRMATSSDAGGNIPRFMTNSSLPGSISADVPSFLKWMVHRFPEDGVN